MKNPRLIEFDASLREHGYAGDTTPAKLAFLALWTGKLSHPVSLVIKGPSGSGKSHALTTALRYVPDSAAEVLHGMSEKALLYSGFDLRHRHLVIQEAAGLSEGVGRAFLRQLLSEGKVRYQTVEATANGIAGKELPPIEGPCGVIMTTTANSLHEEDESRLLSFNIEDSETTRRAVLLAQAKGKVSMPSEAELAAWHALHDAVSAGGPEPVIPFAERIAERLPDTHDRLMRDFPQLLSLIGANALLNADSRERDESGAVIATVADYDEVREMLEPVLAHGLEASVPDDIRRLVEAVAELTDGRLPFDGPVTQYLLSEKLERDRSVISRAVSRAVAEGYLTDDNPGQGRTSDLRLGQRPLPSGTVLPTAEELAAI